MEELITANDKPVVAVDVHGGDLPVNEVVQGAIMAGKKFDVYSILVGDENQIRDCLPQGWQGLRSVTELHASEVVTMDDDVRSMLQKKDSSMLVAIQQVRDRSANAVVSVGNSGAFMALAKRTLGMIGTWERPAIAVTLPTEHGSKVLLDAGANVGLEKKPQYLRDFAVMGSIYAERVLGIATPRIALISVGEELTKGSPLVLEARRLMEEMGYLNLIPRHVQGNDLFKNFADVYVSDGEIGNVVFKTVEGTASEIVRVIRQYAEDHSWSRIPLRMLKPMFRHISGVLDPRQHGGVPLLGPNGVVIVCHGNSDRIAVCNAIGAAKKMAEKHLVSALSGEV